MDALRVWKAKLLSGSGVDDTGQKDAAAAADPDRLRPPRLLEADGFGGLLVGLVVRVRILRR